METIRDCHGHVICKVDSHNGTVELKYRHLTLELHIEQGDGFTVHRENTVTQIKRVAGAQFTVSSNIIKS